MLTNVVDLLDFRNGCIPEGEVIVIGQNQPSLEFLLHHIISSALRSSRFVCLTSFVQKFHHYNAISMKLMDGIHLQDARNAKQFDFIDGLDELSRQNLCDSAIRGVDHSKCDQMFLDYIKDKITKSANCHM